MALQKREKILAGVTGALVVAAGGLLLLRGGGKSLDELRAARNTLSEDVERMKVEARPGEEAGEQLDRWRKRALATNDRVAAMYNDWLSELVVSRVGFDRAKITPIGRQGFRGVYTTLPFRVEGTGSLEQVARFLYAFESAGYLHKLHRLSFTPDEGAKRGKVVMTVEALCLPDAVHQDSLPVGQPSRLDHADLSEYLETIVRRRMEDDRYVEAGGLFVAYQPPPDRPGSPPPEAGPPAVDPSRHTYVTAINAVNGTPEVWLFVRTEGKTLRLHEGEPFEVGTVSGTIARIHLEAPDVEIDLGGRRQLVALGENLHEGVALPE